MRVAPLVLCGLVSLIVCGGCRAHVALPPPPDKGAPLEARTHAYEQLKLEPAAREDLSVRTRLFQDRPSVTRAKATLMSGVRIDAVEDLRPLVEPASPTGLALQQAAELRDRSDLLMGGGLALSGAGVVTALALTAVDLGVTPELSRKPVQGVTPLLIGAAAAFLVGVAGGGALATWGMVVRDDADDTGHRAYQSYDADLRARLGLPLGEGADTKADSSASPASVP